MGARGIMLQSPVTSRFSLPAPLKYPAGLAEDRTLSDAVGVAKNTTEKAAAEAELSVFKPLLPSEIRKFALSSSCTLSPLLSSKVSSRIHV